MPSNTTYILFTNVFFVDTEWMNVGIVEQTFEAGKKVHYSN